MNICFWGSFDHNYSRTHVLIKGLRQKGVKVIICNNRSSLLPRWWYLFNHARKLLYDWIYIPFSFLSGLDILLAKGLSFFTHKKVVYDALVSVHESMVYDRKITSATSISALIYFLSDSIALHLADHIVCDTEQNVSFYVNTYKLKHTKFSVVQVGTDTDVFFPITHQPRNSVNVGFWGSFIPLHGLEYILGAIYILRNERHLIFQILGNGQVYNKIISMAREYKLSNCQFLPPVEYSKLPLFINELDLVLGGPFGNSLKAHRVVPNKVYEALACKKAVIVGDTAATKSMFDSSEVIFCQTADEHALANTIITYAGNGKLRTKIAEQGYRWLKNKGTQKKVADQFIQALAAGS